MVEDCFEFLDFLYYLLRTLCIYFVILRNAVHFKVKFSIRSDLLYPPRQNIDNKSDICIFEILVTLGIQICLKKSIFGTTFTTSELAGFEPAIFG